MSAEVQQHDQYTDTGPLCSIRAVSGAIDFCVVQKSIGPFLEITNLL